MTEDITIAKQAVSFLLFVLGGMLTGALYDFLKIAGVKYFYKNDSLRWYDFLTAVLLFLFVLIIFLLINNLQAEFYCFAGLIIGILLYLSSVSQLARKFFMVFLSFSEKILKILLYPLKILCIIVKRFVIILKKLSLPVFNIVKKTVVKKICSFNKVFKRAKKI